MQISSHLRSRLIQFHQDGQVHLENNIHSSRSKFIQLRLGAYQLSPEMESVAQFQSNVSITCFERLLRKHQGHYSVFNPPVVVRLEPSANEEQVWVDMQRGVQYIQTIVATHEDRCWGIHARSVQREQREHPLGSKDWLGDQKHDSCFMLDHNLRLTLSKHLITRNSPFSTTFEVSLDVLPQIENLTGRSNESSQQYVDRVVIPALRSVMQLIQNTHHPMTATEAGEVRRAFFQLTDTQPQNFRGLTSVVLDEAELVSMLDASEDRRSSLNIMLTDTIDQATPAFIYIHRCTIYLFTPQDGLRQISHSDPHTASWNETVIVGESSVEDHFYALDLFYNKGARLLDDSRNLFAERSDSMNLCHGDLETIYRRAPFMMKQYTFCRDSPEVHQGIKRIFNNFSQRGPYTIGGIAICYADRPLKRERLVWSAPPLLRLRFGDTNEVPQTMYASGPNKTTCLLEEIGISVQTPYFANQVGMFQFQQQIEDSSPKLQLICFAEESEETSLDDVDVVMAQQKECRKQVHQSRLEGNRDVKLLPPSKTPTRSILAEITSFRPLKDRSILTPGLNVLNPLTSPITTSSAPCRKRKNAPQASSLCSLLKPTPKRLNLQ